MGVFALNSFKIQELMDLAVEENELMLKWLTALEADTLRAEEGQLDILKDLNQA